MAGRLGTCPSSWWPRAQHSPAARRSLLQLTRTSAPSTETVRNRLVLTTPLRVFGTKGSDRSTISMPSCPMWGKPGGCPRLVFRFIKLCSILEPASRPTTTTHHPQCLYFLDQLLDSRFRTELQKPEFINWLRGQQILHWKYHDDDLKQMQVGTYFCLTLEIRHGGGHHLAFS